MNCGQALHAGLDMSATAGLQLSIMQANWPCHHAPLKLCTGPGSRRELLQVLRPVRAYSRREKAWARPRACARTNFCSALPGSQLPLHAALTLVPLLTAGRARLLPRNLLLLVLRAIIPAPATWLLSSACILMGAADGRWFEGGASRSAYRLRPEARGRSLGSPRESLAAS